MSTREETVTAWKNLLGKAQGADETREGTVQSIADDGTAWVLLAGDLVPSPCKLEASCRVGDSVMVRVTRKGRASVTGNRTDPSASSRALAAAQATADEASQVANATNQHFWDDSNGAHVTDMDQGDWLDGEDMEFPDLSDLKPYHNLLMNSLGILIRRAHNNLVSITKSAITFFDGLGNAASNVVASFGANGAQIGKASSAHVEITGTGTEFYDYAGNSCIKLSSYSLSTRNASKTIYYSSTASGTKTTIPLQNPPNFSSSSITIMPVIPFPVVDEVTISGYDVPKTLSITSSRSIRITAKPPVGELLENPEWALYIEEIGSDFGSWPMAVFWMYSSNDPTYSFGKGNQVTGSNAMAIGSGLIANGEKQVAIGEFNASSPDSLLVIGNGYNSTSAGRKNVFSVGRSGNVVAAGSITFSGGTLGSAATHSHGDYAAASHTHAIADVTNLQTTLNGKAASSHTHSYLPLSGGMLTGHLVMSSKYVYLDSSNIDIDNAPSSGTTGTGRITARDKNDKAVAQLIPYIASNGRYGWQFGTAGNWAYVTTDGTDPHVAFTNAAAWRTGLGLGTAATRADSYFLKRTPGSSDLPSTTNTGVFPIVLSDTFANSGVISYMSEANFRTAMDLQQQHDYYAASSATNVTVANTSLYRFLVILFRTNSATYTGGGASAATSPLNSTVVHINKKSSGSVYVSLMGAHALSGTSVQIRTGLATVTCSATAGKVTLSNQRYINLGNGASGTQEVGTQTDMALVGVVGIY